MAVSQALETREARPGDAEALVALLSILGYAANVEQVRGRLGRIAGDDDYRVWVGIVEGHVVGYAAGRLSLTLEYDEPIVQVIGLAVLPEYQGRGVGAQLLGLVERWAEAHGACLVHLTSGSHREEAHGFYRGHGYEMTGIRFVKHLRGSGRS